MAFMKNAFEVEGLVSRVSGVRLGLESRFEFWGLGFRDCGFGAWDLGLVFKIWV